MTYQDSVCRNIEEYLRWISVANQSSITSDSESHTLSHNKMYYRGQASKCWRLNPGIFRTNLSTPPETRILKQAALRLWRELSVYPTYLEKLVYLQHYGLKTRLLDVTLNPLIALYFACEMPNNIKCKERKDGAVYCGWNFNRENGRIAELTVDFIFSNSFNDIDFIFDKFTQSRGTQKKEFSQPLFIVPPFNNPRIEHQKGAFIMAPLIQELDDGPVIANKEPLDDSGFFRDQRAIIPMDCKQNILKELHLLGIDAGSVYQDTEDKIRAILQEEKWDEETCNNILTE